MRDSFSIPGSGRSPGGGHGDPFQLKNLLLAWRIPWTEEPGRLQSIGSQRIGHDLRDSACTHKKLYGASQVALMVKNLPENAEDIRDAGSVTGSE